MIISMKTTTKSERVDDEVSPKVLIITGMHRSTTSLITQWLRRCGLFIGERSPGNAHSEVEDPDFLRVHEQLLKSRRFSTAGLVHKPIPQLTCQEVEQLRALIDTRNKEHDEWGWKDPRTCLFLDTYATLIPDAFYLVIFRSFEETISSLLIRRYKESVKKYQHKTGISGWIWEHYKKKRRMKVWSNLMSVGERVCAKTSISEPAG